MTSAITKPSEALRAARELLTPEGAWIKKEAATTAQGDILDHGFQDGACRWCSVGAIEAAEGRAWWYCKSWPFLNEAMNHDVAVTNDDASTTHEHVISYFTRAIALAEEAGQ